MTNKKLPQRVCVGCKEFKDKKSLIRLVKTPEDKLELDFTGKKAGRGAYLCNDVLCLQKAIKNKGMERSLKTRIAPEVLDQLKDLFAPNVDAQEKQEKT